jgi:hypothetical protein
MHTYIHSRTFKHTYKYIRAYIYAYIHALIHKSSPLCYYANVLRVNIVDEMPTVGVINQHYSTTDIHTHIHTATNASVATLQLNRHANKLVKIVIRTHA